ncbi:MAG TPA: hypothetical protein DD435_07595 [Cyanobacteria bacterium UBA8530]|nr:hypothetical protein [Cyanobacteria bacterium UBA8530]
MKKRLFFEFSISLLFLSVAPAFAEGKAWSDAPWSLDSTEKALWSNPSPSPLSKSFPSPLAFVIRLYQVLISSQDGAVCPMYPTCSAFGMQALGRYGALEGLLMTADRLLRDNPYAHYPHMPLNGREYLYDPVEDHVLW